MRGVRTQLRGEAVPVHLPHGQVLFALLRTPESSQGTDGLPLAAIPAPRSGDVDAIIDQVSFIKMRGSSGVVPRHSYPMFVTFSDLHDPKTIQLVDPDDMESTFGPGVKLTRITVEITDAPITTGLKCDLEWLASQKGQLVTAEPTDPLARRALSDVVESDFIRG
jgi:hypothetical protein